MKRSSHSKGLPELDPLEILHRKSAREQRARESAEQLLEQKSRELYRANQILLEAKREAEQASLAKNQFIANMSHEIRTPLNAILGMVQLLVDENLTGLQKRRLMVIREAGMLLTSTINDILDLGRIEAGAMTTEETQTDIRTLFDGIISVFRTSAEQKGLSLYSKVDSAIPRLINLDATKFRQIATNLLGNAIKFTDSGFINCSLNYLNSGSCGELTFVVRDTGIGISEDKAVEIFEPFKQSDNSITRRFGGTGLGLSIARTLAELLGGALAVKSKPGVGSTFTLRIPCTESIDEDSALPPVTPVVSSPFIRKPKILVVEDNLHNQDVMIGVLERLHCEVSILNNGQAALDLLRTCPKRFDLVLSDLHMPQMGGAELAKEIRSMGLDVPFIAMTGDVRIDIRDECFQLGMTGFLAKPFQIRSLRELLLRNLDHLSTGSLFNDSSSDLS